jgi:hypothetical protein
VLRRQARFAPALRSMSGLDRLKAKNAPGCHDSDTQSGMNAPANAMKA